MKYTIILINIEQNKYTIIFNFKIRYPCVARVRILV